MSRIDRLTGLWTRPLSSRTLDARIRLLPRAAAVLVTLSLGTALALQLAVSRQLDTVRDAYPALEDARALSATLSALRAAAAAGSHGDDQGRRADSLSMLFHSMARAGHGSAMAAADARFSEYMVQAHRASLGVGSDGDGVGSSAVEAEASARVLAAELAVAERSAARDLSLAVASAQSLQSTVAMVLAGAGLLSVIALLALGVAARRSVTDWVDGMTGTVDALVDGDLSIMIRDSADGPAGRMNTALCRLARQLRENADTAHSLAAGAYRRAARNAAPRDPVGLGLALIATSMSEIAGASERMARGDLTAVVTPKSPDDSFGHAHAAMSRRVIGALRDVEVTRESIASMADAMRGDVAALASSATTDVDRLRRTHERLELVTMQAGADAARGTERARRLAESETMLDDGSAALQASLSDVGEVMRGTARVQQLARDAARLAVGTGMLRTSAEASAVAAQQESARTLAREAANMTGSLTRLMIDGTERVNAAGVALDRVALVVQDQLAMAREVDAAVRRHANDLHEIDATVSHVQRTTSNSAETARQLVIRLDALASQTRRLDAVLRRFDKGRSPVIRPRAVTAATTGPVLHQTPPHTHLAYPQLRIVGS